MVISVKLFRFQYIETYQRCSPAVRDPRGVKTPRDLVAIVR